MHPDHILMKASRRAGAKLFLKESVPDTQAFQSVIKAWTAKSRIRTPAPTVITRNSMVHRPGCCWSRIGSSAKVPISGVYSLIAGKAFRETDHKKQHH
jgi:hypothetical protein